MSTELCNNNCIELDLRKCEILQLVFKLILAEFLHTLIDLRRDVSLVRPGDHLQDLQGLLRLPPGDEPPGGLGEEEGDGEDGDHLRENNPVKWLPVAEIFSQPGLVNSTERQGCGQTNVPHQSPLLYGNILQD